MRKLALLFIVLLLPLALAQNESEEALVCGGALTFELSPTTAAYYQEVTATVGGLENCDGKIADIRLSSCKGAEAASCSIASGGCEADFEAPNATATQRYYACVDMNDDGSFGATEMKSTTLALRPPTCDELVATAEQQQAAADYAAAAACYYKLVKSASDIGMMTKCDYYYVSAANVSEGLPVAQYLEQAAICHTKDAVKTRGRDLYYACAGAYMAYAYSLEEVGDLLNAVTYYGKAAENCYKNAGETGNLTHYSFLRNTYIVKLQARLNGQNVTIPYNISKLAADPKLPLSQITAGATTGTDGGQQPEEGGGGGDITPYIVLALVVAAGIGGFVYYTKYWKKRQGGQPPEEEFPEGRGEFGDDELPEEPELPGEGEKK